jgi:hypothetical protein
MRDGIGLHGKCGYNIKQNFLDVTLRNDVFSYSLYLVIRDLIMAFLFPNTTYYIPYQTTRIQTYYVICQGI